MEDPESGAPLADHPVSLDPAARGTRAFEDLYSYLRWRADPDRRTASEAELLDWVGTWIGQRVLGEKLCRRMVAEAPVSVRVLVLEFLAFRPLELAYVDGVPLVRHGVSLVYEVGAAGRAKAPVAGRLRMVALFPSVSRSREARSEPETLSQRASEEPVPQ